LVGHYFIVFIHSILRRLDWTVLMGGTECGGKGQT
jgi:hypothetical protein